MKTQKLTSLFAALLLAGSSVNSLPQTASARLTDPPAFAPSDFASAFDFTNDFGVTYCTGNMVCLVFREPVMEIGALPEGITDVIPVPQITVTGCKVNTLYDSIYRAPVTDVDAKPTMEYDDRYQYEVVVYEAAEAGEFQVAFTPWDGSAEEKVYTFASDGEVLLETDIYGWLPDCTTEYETFVNRHGNASVHDNYAVFCFAYSEGTAYLWNDKSEIASAAPCFTKYMTSNCAWKNPSRYEVAGGRSQYIQLYEATAAGRQTFLFELSNEGMGFKKTEVIETIEADLCVTQDLQNILTPDDVLFMVMDEETTRFVDIPRDDGQHYAINTSISATLPDGTTVYTGPITILESNPFRAENFNQNFSAESFSYWLTTPDDFEPAKTASGADSIRTDVLENGAREITFYVTNKLNKKVFGDINHNGTLDKDDLERLLEWLQGTPSTAAADWDAADADGNGVLNVIDYTILKQTYKADTAYTYKAVPTCKLELHSRYYLTSPDGSSKTTKEETELFFLEPQDFFFEERAGVWLQNLAPDYPRQPILQIKDITEEGVVVAGNYGGDYTDKLIPYDVPQESLCAECEENIIYDGINAIYTLTFFDFEPAEPVEPD